MRHAQTPPRPPDRSSQLSADSQPVAFGFRYRVPVLMLRGATPDGRVLSTQEVWQRCCLGHPVRCGAPTMDESGWLPDSLGLPTPEMHPVTLPPTSES